MIGPAADDPIRRRDEILQVMYWMRGEGLADAPDVGELERLLGDARPFDRAALEAELRALAAAGLVEAAGPGRYRLTERGAAEGGRRFADEFAGLTGQGHGACSDPDCDCHTEGPEACTATR